MAFKPSFPTHGDQLANTLLQVALQVLRDSPASRKHQFALLKKGTFYIQVGMEAMEK